MKIKQSKFIKWISQKIVDNPSFVWAIKKEVTDVVDIWAEDRRTLVQETASQAASRTERMLIDKNDSIIKTFKKTVEQEVKHILIDSINKYPEDFFGPRFIELVVDRINKVQLKD